MSPMTGDPDGHRGGRRGPIFWRRIEELADSPDLIERARREFPSFAALAEGSMDRRRFLQLTAASMALMGLTACGLEVAPRDREPYVEQPAGIVPGRWRYFATATALQGYGTGVLVKHEMGRPLKIEGNPDHPASLGATSAIGQASILELYNPFRADTLTRDGAIAPWSAFTTAVIERRQQLLSARGRGLALLTGTVTSPTLLAQIGELRRDYPQLRWYQWEAVDREPVRAGAQLVYGRAADVLPDFARADVILAAESDFLESAPGHLRFARDFASRRRAAEVKERMSRLYALESTPTLAGAKADHRLALTPVAIEAAMRRLAGMLGAGPADWARGADPNAKTLDAIAADLRRAQGRALVHVGAAQPPVVHALGAAINHALGAYGQTLSLIEPVAPPPQAGESLSDLTDAMSHGEVDTLIILADNPVYGAPADLDFERVLRTVPFSIYLGEYADETAEAVHWHLPRAHEYEAWSDVRAFDGTISIQQPQMLPRGERHSAHELLAVLLGQTTTPDGRAIVREHWQTRAEQAGTPNFDSYWMEALSVGIVRDSAAARIELEPRADLPRSLEPAGGAAPRPDELTALFRPDIYLWDGRFADNGWLQEMGRPFTRLTWDNAALLSPRTAQRLGLETADLVEVELRGRRVRAPVWVLPGQAEDCVTLPLGYGRRRTGPVGEGVGFNAFALRTRAMPWQGRGAVLSKLEGRYRFAVIQHEGRTLGRDLVREGSLADFLEKPTFLHYGPAAQSLYPDYPYPGIAWGMSINLDACIGCHACVTACQAENNSPVVGKTEVWRNREMHWLRIDRYYEGPLENPEFVFQPVPCMQCENAPCEVVCPVHATVHDSQGVNVMVYNRCVGTRFCSNNCPYKVRRFNFFDYTASDPRPRESWNPEVTVRARGVMEKCTYCVQRTRMAMIAADEDNRRIRDGEVVTACQQACPTEAIVFGDQNDPKSAVSRRKASPLDYAMLGELNTRPRTTYEALIRNPNPALAAKEEGGHA